MLLLGKFMPPEYMGVDDKEAECINDGGGGGSGSVEDIGGVGGRE